MSKESKKIQQVLISRKTRNGQYNDILDAAEVLAFDCGSTTNAIAVMVRQSKLYREIMGRMRGRGGAPRPDSDPLGGRRKGAFDDG